MRKGERLMIRKHTLIRCYGAFLVLALLAAMTGTASGVTFTVRAEPDELTKTMLDSTEVTMWGFALVEYDIGAGPVPGDNIVMVPGPLLEVPPGDDTLVINLQNNLEERTSLVIPGLGMPTDGGGVLLEPVFFFDSHTSARQRVRSFTAETIPGNTGTYIWNNVKPGTYLYQSGTHPGVQVQMGLYGGLKKDFALGQAYDTIPPEATAYAKEGIVLFSEIDPDLHAVVANGSYGDPDNPNNPKQITSPMDYAPKYFLINGDADLAGTGIVQTDPINVGDQVLVRLLNAGLKTRVPVLLGSYMTLLAQDGNLAPHARETYDLTLTAGKTMDVMVTPTVAGSLVLSDRRGFVTPGATAIGGTAVVSAVGLAGERATGGTVAAVDPASGTSPSTTAPSGGGGGGCFISTVFN
jgi:FtsP/CotA-like multicopper oxidase with cupredoxin domain